MILTKSEGNLVDNFFDLKYSGIAHGCNCFNTMGRGIALEIKNRIPEAYAADCQTVKGDINKLGSYSIFESKYGFVANLYTQFTYWEEGVLIDWEALENALTKLIEGRGGSTDHPLCIGVPYIGCGLAGGEESDLIEVLEKVVAKFPTINGCIELVRFNK